MFALNVHACLIPNKLFVLNWTLNHLFLPLFPSSRFKRNTKKTYQLFYSLTCPPAVTHPCFLTVLNHLITISCPLLCRLFFLSHLSLSFTLRYIPPDKREENDQSTHKWMVYVRGSRREPSIDHFVKKVWFFLHPSYKPNDLVEVRFVPVHFSTH